MVKGTGQEGVNFVGVDLAWGEKNGTGLCAFTANGTVISSRQRTMHEIVRWLMPYTAGDCLVAIDAPLIVTNQHGRRPCEAMITHCYGKHDAGAHSSNLSNPSFRTGGRARELAQLLHLDSDPFITPRAPIRRAIEVYPHSALVALFDLTVTFKYKDKRGRTGEARQREFESCIARIKSLATEDPPLSLDDCQAWHQLTAEIAAATTKAGLDRAEDELDAYICTYIALYYWTHGLTRSRVVGDTVTGYIVTPVSTQQAACLDKQAAALRKTGA
jgi:predicted RNase H-like nuclease